MLLHALYSFPTRRSSDLPILMEAMTYRYEGHGMSDKVFQTRTEELEKYMEQDPIKKLDKQLIERYPEIKGKLDEIHQQRSEEHTSELQSRFDLVCRLLLE